ncbi:MAG: radical SAM protein [Candidatus Woesearchaeota archaeon]
MNNKNLLHQSKKVYLENFPNTVKFERAIFFSWGCDLRDCAFCYMSTQPKEKETKKARRSFASIFAECIISKNLNWDLGLLSGGIGAFNDQEMEFMLKTIKEIYNDKIWLNMGVLNEKQIIRFKPYLKGIVGSVETINPNLHDKLCPSKPLSKIENMFQLANKHNINRAMTFIVGMGETQEDFILLKEFISKFDIKKIHLYGLNPQVGTIFENSKPPSIEQQSWWIANLRINFPKLDIECGIWEDRMDYIPYLLNAGANSISKLRALKVFGTKKANVMINEIKKSERNFKSEFLNIPNINWDNEIERLDLDKKIKFEIKIRLNKYLDNLNS